ncbi:MAG TPA: hypothetical protein PLY93_05605 [Turneriella sp.]|nr:hypothetical protein [Turneriella sp.]
MVNEGLKFFNFSPEIIARMRETQEIPVNFYNANGQVLIPRKEQASGDMINKLLQHIATGVFYREDEEHRLGIKSSVKTEEGLADTKLLSEKKVAEIAEAAESLLNDLKFATFGVVHSQKMNSQVNSFITDFEQQPDLMVGVINILDTVKVDSTSAASQQAVKRAVVAMALKSRSMKAMISKDRGRGSEAMQPLMMSGMLAQIGKVKMNLPDTDKLTLEQRAYIHKYPLLSYLMVAHEETISFEVKRLILNQKRTLPENMKGNNYPSLPWMKQTLQTLAQENEKKGRTTIVGDIFRQLTAFKEFVLYEEDVNILSLANDFAELTTETENRAAHDPEQAIKTIVNGSYFQYGPKVIRDFLDYISMSLSHNQKIIKNGDLLILALSMQSGKTYFEVVRVLEVGRFQSRAMVQRLGIVNMQTVTEAGLHFSAFQVESFRADPRKIHINLAQDFLRRIVYIVDEKLEPQLFEKLSKRIQ